MWTSVSNEIVTIMAIFNSLYFLNQKVSEYEINCACDFFLLQPETLFIFT